MKKTIKASACLLGAFLMFQAGGLVAKATESAPDISLAEGKIAYSSASGLYMEATETTYDVWAPAGVTPYYGVSLALKNAGNTLNVKITNENAFNQSIRFNLVTATAKYSLGAKNLVPGKNTVCLNATDAEGFTGEIKALEVIGDAFFSLNGAIIIEGVEDERESVIWNPYADDYERIENEAVTFSVYLIDANMVVGRNPERDKWYPILFKTGNDMSGYEGFSFYADTTIEGKEVYFNKYVQELLPDGTVGEQWYLPDDAVYNCYPETGRPFMMTGNLIPAYFKGTIVTSFDDLEIPDWATEYNGVLDLNNTDGQIGFTFDGSRGEFVFGLSDFQLVKTVEKIVVEKVVQGDIVFIDDMSSYTDGVTAGYAWRTNWSLASPCKTELVQNPAQSAGAGGNALLITPLDAPKNPAPDALTGSTVPTNYTALEYFPAGGSFDIAGSRGITFFVKNEKRSPFFMNFEFDILQEGLRQRWAVKQYGRYILYDTVTGTQKLYNAFQGIYIPAGFCGWVRVDFSQFVNPSWESVAGDFTTESGLVYFVINIETIRFSGHTFLFDSLGVYTEKAEISTPFHTPEKDVATAIGGAAQ